MSTILLVDDDDSYRMTLSVLLEDEGFTVRTASSSGEARTLLSAASGPDLVLLDQHLGDGLGADLVVVIRDCFPRTKVVLMSGSVEVRALSREGDGCFEKGAAFQDLRRLISDLLVDAR